MAAHVCEPVGDFLCPDDRPSPIFSTFAAGINFITGVWCFIVALTNSCESAPRTWLLLACVNCAVNFCFAFYLYFRFARKVRGDDESPGLAPGDAACKLFMYDWGVCSYMTFAVWQLVWFFMAINVAGDHPDDKCGDQLHIAATLFAIFVGVGILLLILSLFTECCRQPRWQDHHQQRRQPTPIMHSAGTAAGSAVRSTTAAIGSLFGGGRRGNAAATGGHHQQQQYQQPPPQQQQQQPFQPRPYGQAPQTGNAPSYYGGGGQQSGNAGATASSAAPPPMNPHYQA